MMIRANIQILLNTGKNNHVGIRPIDSLQSVGSAFGFGLAHFIYLKIE